MRDYLNTEGHVDNMNDQVDKVARMDEWIDAQMDE